MKRITMKEALEHERKSRSWFKALIVNPIIFVLGLIVSLFVLVLLYLGSIV